MKYIVTEIQTNIDGTVGTLLNAYDSRNQAESQFHTVMAAAAISALPIHACTIVTNEGFTVNSGCYHHDEPAPVEAEEQ